ncbi:hypothetical protein IU450_28215 [Nocardia abscessus]|uniref:hypothetical protein n=1 Tax=Nocardia abscessus TaxID=120957 RepID=UPI001895E394|nr:hypothetical protein [Nocardia abscessus]MBF6339744.1 hypothetical protein [Nocardia abscessus]
MNPSHAHRIGVVAALAFTAPLAAAGLLACGTENTSESHGMPSMATTAAPTRLRWQPFQGVDLPVADQGPHHIEGPVATGYHHSPAGAALAAIQSTVRMSIATDSQWPMVGQRMLAPGPGRDAWATARAQISIAAPIANGAPKVLGYVIGRYTLGASDVDIYSLHPDNSVTRNRTHVLWHSDDWRLQLPDNPTAASVTAVDVPPADMVALTPR